MMILTCLTDVSKASAAFRIASLLPGKVDDCFGLGLFFAFFTEEARDCKHNANSLQLFANSYLGV